MKKQRKLVFGLIIVLILVIFACLNTEQVAINFGFFQPKMPLIIILITMILLGAFISMLLGTNKDVKHVKEEYSKQEATLKKQLNDQINKKDQEINKLKQEISKLKEKSTATTKD
ncbi:DUF1049 domain-containing protein [Lactobacillus sp. PV037]|uniref:lipopolysaccharide assembly protein LapA domain-containing protein n=1 Tax=unclassified Lactobacillus TaxID=2620435 RepID=UPI00223FDF0C|nr:MULTISPECIES: lipopolysaccharide assembly protein LapA domain-containing protein [unclassified Lactobacillus]QNQ82374.1 DUF1049 domain-containing protein [Lactobacillus sp. PV012]QNQ83512.1 DUF1049 domain-containing protein [Lactobacillus sp. PV037]